MKVKDLFDVKHGVNLELMHCEIADSEDTDGINFVARTGNNNGVVAFVKRIDGIEPHKAGIISCAAHGSTMSSFVQLKPFYSGRALYVLTPKKELTLQEKLYYCMCLKSNAYRYNYGRSAEKTLRDIELPDSVPGWVSKTDVKQIKTSVKKKVLPLLDTANWRGFYLDDLFSVSTSKDKYLFESSFGKTPYVTSSAENNAVTGFIDVVPTQEANTLTIARNGSVGSTFYQPKPYCCSPDDIRILTPRFDLNVYIALFIKTIIEKEKYKYAYGRKLGTKRIEKLIIKLPVTKQGVPDWTYMENYIKSLPYSDRI